MMEPALEPFTDVLTRIEAQPASYPLCLERDRHVDHARAGNVAELLRRLICVVPCSLRLAFARSPTDPDILFLEVGPGNALASLARLTLGKERAKHVVSSLSHPHESRADGEAVLDAAGRLWLAGVELDWANLHAGASPRRVPLPTYPFERKRYWVEAAPAAASSAEVDAVRQSDRCRRLAICADLDARSVPRQQNCRVCRVPGCCWPNQGHSLKRLSRPLKRSRRQSDFGRTWRHFQIVDAEHFRARHGHAQDISAIVRHVRGDHRPNTGRDLSGK